MPREATAGGYCNVGPATCLRRAATPAETPARQAMAAARNATSSAATGRHLTHEWCSGFALKGDMQTFRDCRQCFIFAQEFKEEANIIIESIFVHC